jgi:hypothetical protein
MVQGLNCRAQFRMVEEFVEFFGQTHTANIAIQN